MDTAAPIRYTQVAGIGGSRKVVSDAAGGIPPKSYYKLQKLRISLPNALLCNSNQTCSNQMCLLFILCEKNGESWILNAAGAFAPDAPSAPEAPSAI